MLIDAALLGMYSRHAFGRDQFDRDSKILQSVFFRDAHRREHLEEEGPITYDIDLDEVKWSR